ncbi:alpha/beta fold hydrolase [Actinoplanes sp. CA-051413]|uniref:alpha/beta fold hydrolase n=1 Tax=Actinoplanes sp. CA-051413 TaxID=3239899 RepID=UPI003D974E15
MPRIMSAGEFPVLASWVSWAVLVAVVAGCEAGPADPGAVGTVGVASARATSGWVAARVDIGGRKLNLNCRGGGSPAIVFESGLGGNLGTWFQTGVAHAFPAVRTCAYDRVNTGTSDRVAARHTGKDSVGDLHELLDVAAVPAPYVLVGHSFGGLLAAMYAGTYPSQVAGLVLIDPSLPTQAELYDLIPERERAAATAEEEQNPENVDFADTLEQAKSLVPKAVGIPVLLLAATSLGNLPSSWPAADMLAARRRALQEFIAQFPRGELRYVESGHFIQTEQPELVISEIQRVLDAVR